MILRNQNITEFVGCTSPFSIPSSKSHPLEAVNHEPFGAILPGTLDAHSRVRNKCFGGLILLSTHNIPICGSEACILFSPFNSLRVVHAILCMPWCSKISTPTPFAFINQFVFTVEVWLASLSSLDMYVLCSHFFPLYTMLPWTAWMLWKWIWKLFSGSVEWVIERAYCKFHQVPSKSLITNTKDWTTNTALYCCSDISPPFVCWPGYLWRPLPRSTVARGSIFPELPLWV